MLTQSSEGDRALFTRLERRRSTTRPIFYLQTSDAGKVTLITGDKHSADGDRVTGNHGVHATDR